MTFSQLSNATFEAMASNDAEERIGDAVCRMGLWMTEASISPLARRAAFIDRTERPDWAVSSIRDAITASVIR